MSHASSSSSFWEGNVADGSIVRAINGGISSSSHLSTCFMIGWGEVNCQCQQYEEWCYYHNVVKRSPSCSCAGSHVLQKLCVIRLVPLSVNGQEENQETTDNHLHLFVSMVSTFSSVIFAVFWIGYLYTYFFLKKVAKLNLFRAKFLMWLADDIAAGAEFSAMIISLSFLAHFFHIIIIIVHANEIFSFVLPTVLPYCTYLFSTVLHINFT